MGKEAVQKESWLTGEPWASPRPRPRPAAPRAVLMAPRQQVARPTPPQCCRAGHVPSWTQGALIVSEALLWLGA